MTKTALAPAPRVTPRMPCGRGDVRPTSGRSRTRSPSHRRIAALRASPPDLLRAESYGPRAVGSNSRSGASRLCPWPRDPDNGLWPSTATRGNLDAMSAHHDPFSYDVFIAHAGPDLPAAQELHGHMAVARRVFLDAVDLLPGDAWDETLPRALRGSRVTVVLVSVRTDRAWYQREEIALAVELTRSAQHRVVPVYLDDEALQSVPYGLRRVHGLFVSREGSLRAIADKLLTMIDRLDGQAAPKTPAAAFQPQPAHISKDDFDADTVDRLVELALRYRADRRLLLAFLPPGIVGRLPDHANLQAQLQSDITALAALGGRGSNRAIATWVRNLESAIAPFPEHAEVQRLRRALGN